MVAALGKRLAGRFTALSLFVALGVVEEWKARAAEVPTVVVHRISGKIQLDGVLNEPTWGLNPYIPNLTQVEPRPGQPPTERTEVRLAYNQDALYIAVRCFDSRPSAIVATEMGRDARLMANDNIQILLDTYHDRRNAYYFATNPVGALVDGRITESRFAQLQWDGIWDVRTRIWDDGWTAEFEIPFKSLGFAPGQRNWGFNVSRHLARLREESRWASPSLDVRFFNVARAGVIEGFEGLSQGIGLDIKPYGLFGFDRDIARVDRFQTAQNGGVDIFYRIASNLVSSTTFNTDFAETEADVRRVNLTRFNLFFPEKRSFFLEDAGVFAFGTGGGGGGGGGGGPGGGGGGGGGMGPDLIPFFSRTIGLYRGYEVPIRVGQKVTGKLGRFDLGFLDVQTGEFLNDDGELITKGQNLAVGRFKANFLRQSYIGAIFTRGDPGGGRNQVGGVDFQLATSNFFKRGKNASLSLFGLQSNGTGLEQRNNAFGGMVAYPNDFVSGFVRWMKIEDNFRPAMGFVPRRGVAISSGRFEVSPRPRFWNLRQLSFGVSNTNYASLQHKAMESQRFQVTPLEMRFNSGERFAYEITQSFERLFRPWEIRPGVTLPAGKYRFHAHSVEFMTSPTKPFSVGADVLIGDFYSGTRRQAAIEFTWRKDRHLTTSLDLERNWIRFPEGRFNTSVIRYRLDYAFTPLIGLANFIQYDSDSRNLGLQSRLRWILKPGNEIHFVINHAWQENSFDRFEAAQMRSRVKLNYTLRF